MDVDLVSYDQMRQIMSQLLQDQFAIQSYLDELDLSNVQVPTQNTEVVDDQSDAARVMSCQLFGFALIVPQFSDVNEPE